MSVGESEKQNPTRCCETSTSKVSEGEGGEAAAPFRLLFFFGHQEHISHKLFV